jgi:nucleoside-diphosphate-sugar epimerase
VHKLGNGYAIFQKNPQTTDHIEVGSPALEISIIRSLSASAQLNPYFNTFVLHLKRLTTMAGELVLLTGATGFVGFATLIETLRYGYKVRAAVRSEQKAETVRSHPTLKDIKSDQLEFIIVPDFLGENAFDEAVKDVTSIVHLASPIPNSNISGEDDLDALMVQPAIEATLAVFRSAQKVNNVKRIIVTSSVVALVPFIVLGGMEKTDKRFGPEDRSDPAPSPYMHNTQIAYITSKNLALKHAEEFIKTEKPSFDVIHIHPSLVLGRDELVTTSRALDSGSNNYAMGIVLGKHAEGGLPASVVHIKDVALAHVRALDRNIPGNQSFLLSNTGDEGWTVCVISPPRRLRYLI